MPLEPGKKYEGQGKRGQGKFSSLKDSFLDAFNSKEMGGTEGLIEWAMTHRNKATFYQMISKMLPTNVKAEIDGKLKLLIEKKITTEIKEDARDKV